LTRFERAYISFDVVPAPKGASTHIEAFARALAPVELVTVAEGVEPQARFERWPGVFHTALPAIGGSVIERVLCFRRYLANWLAKRQFDSIQFRSPFEGWAVCRADLPVRARPPGRAAVFEVNGLPSIELKYRYPRAAGDRELLAKLIAQERACIDRAALIVTPSAVTARFLARERGADPTRIRVIPNGVDTTLFAPASHSPRDDFRMLYFGTLATWQGVALAIRACAQIPATLTIIGAAGRHQIDALGGLAAKLGIGSRVRILPGVPQAELVAHLHQSDAVLAPLTLNDRNVTQGCCPLKILEGMAAGVPVIASDLEVVRELGRAEEHFLLVKPGSVDEIAAAASRLARDPDLCNAIAARARARVLERFTWDRASNALRDAYQEFGITRASPWSSKASS
jgi:glycosyltransferase involved in cell wall biosynthesis